MSTERMTGTDATFLHMERTGPTHTLKVLILDTERRGHPVTSAEVRLAAEWLSTRLPRLRQVVRFAPLFGGLPFWVEAPHLNLDDHLDERTVASSQEFRALLGELAGRPLDRSRPLWSATLVHGLPGERQAVVIRVSHAIGDGTASVNCLARLTSPVPGGPAADPPAPAADSSPPATGPPSPDLAGAEQPSSGELFRMACRDLMRRTMRAGRVVRKSRTGSKEGKRFRREHDMPNLLAVKPNYLTSRFDTRRTCAMASLPLADLKAVGTATGLTVNSVLHALVAGALRRESAARGEEGLPPMIATFGVASDPGSPRLSGNHVDVAFVNLHTDIDDPVRRLTAVGRSTIDAVELRRMVGLGSQDELMDYVPRLPSLIIAILSRWLTAGHLVTANVKGPAEPRWIGNVLIADWYSFAIIVPPYSLNLTVHSYAGALNVGLMTHPDVMPEPQLFLDGLQESLDELLMVVAASRSASLASDG